MVKVLLLRPRRDTALKAHTNHVLAFLLMLQCKEKIHAKAY